MFGYIQVSTSPKGRGCAACDVNMPKNAQTTNIASERMICCTLNE